MTNFGKGWRTEAPAVSDEQPTVGRKTPGIDHALQAKNDIHNAMVIELIGSGRDLITTRLAEMAVGQSDDYEMLQRRNAQGIRSVGPRSGWGRF